MKKRTRAAMLVIGLSAAVTMPAAAPAQVAAPAGFVRSVEMPLPSLAPTAVQYSRTPRWVKWGLLGAAAGAVTFALLSETDPDNRRSVAGDAAFGAVFGFAVIGGGVAFWDWVCKPESASQRAGLC